MESCEPYRIGVLLVAVEEYAQFVDAVGDLVLVENVEFFLLLAGSPEHLVQRQHGVIAGVIGIVAGRPVDHLAAPPQREIIGDRNRLVVGD